MVLLIPFTVNPCTVRRLISFCPGARYDNTGFCSWHYDDLLSTVPHRPWAMRWEELSDVRINLIRLLQAFMSLQARGWVEKSGASAVPENA